MGSPLSVRFWIATSKTFIGQSKLESASVCICLYLKPDGQHKDFAILIFDLLIDLQLKSSGYSSKRKVKVCYTIVGLLGEYFVFFKKILIAMGKLTR
jgi:hypothetical protein